MRLAVVRACVLLMASLLALTSCAGMRREPPRAAPGKPVAAAAAGSVRLVILSEPFGLTLSSIGSTEDPAVTLSRIRFDDGKIRGWLER